MNLLADESVDGPIVERLRRAGHRVWYVAEMEPGASDGTVLDLANREGSLLLTADRDFGELVYRQHRLMPGVVLVRLAGLSPTQKAGVVASVVDEHGAVLPQAFTVITRNAVRIRRSRE
jgi:predicted nuclease of predicted toxin-antitoxin system